MSEDQEKEIVNLERYLRKHKDSEFILELRRLSGEQLKERIKGQALYRQETISAKQKDQDLKQAKDTARALGAPYSESLRLNDKISRFISLLLDENGQA